jgi:opine dehydrogenase
LFKPVPANSKKAAVIGAGPIGCATAGWLSRAGLEVGIYDVAPTAVEPIHKSKKVRLQGAAEFEAPISLATTEISEVLQDAGLVIMAVPASVHENVAKLAAKHIEDGAILVIQPGQTLSAMAFLREARQNGFSRELTPVQTLNTLFTARLVGPGLVDVFALKKFVRFAALPAQRTDQVAKVLQPIFEHLTPADSILEIDLHNFNAVLHPPITLLNVGLVDSASQFLYYMDGATPHVAKLVAAVDRERLAILAGLGLPGLPILEWFERAYNVKEKDLYQAVAATGPYATIAGPTSMNTRLLLEDIPTGLVPYCSLAELAGVAVSLMRSIVDTCCSIYQIDFWSSGRSLARLGLGKLTQDELLEQMGPADR